MIILAIDSSGMTASCAIATEDKVLAEFNVNNKKTHSQTLLPMIDTLKKILELNINDIDAIAVSKGPGSFTGLRIGSATAKGIALAIDKPIIEVSSLEAMAYQIFASDAVICPMMDARREQVYTGIFEYDEQSFKRLSKDRPLAVTEIIEEINQIGRKTVFLGDGVPVYENIIKENLTVPYLFAPEACNRQRAAALAGLAFEYANRGLYTDPDMHRPEYLRLSQAERERLSKQEN